MKLYTVTIRPTLNIGIPRVILAEGTWQLWVKVSRVCFAVGSTYGAVTFKRDEKDSDNYIVYKNRMPVLTISIESTPTGGEGQLSMNF